MSRLWLAILTFAFVVITAARADAQVFKPRGKSGNAPAKAAPAKTKKAPAARKGDSPSRVATKAKKSRAADEARPSDLTPTETKKAKKAPKGKAGKAAKADEENAPEIGDDEVIITDDDD